MAFSGIIPLSPGNRHMALHNRATSIPAVMVAGSSWRWSSVFIIMRAICGTASPMKAMGPQNAVADAVRSPVTNSSLLRSATVFTPRFSAYCSPSNSMLSGLTSMSEHARPITVTAVNVGMLLMDTPPKLPRPHTMYEWTPSSVAKKLSKDIADDAM